MLLDLIDQLAIISLQVLGIKFLSQDLIRDYHDLLSGDDDFVKGKVSLVQKKIMILINEEN